MGCVKTIHAPLISAAPTRWHRWRRGQDLSCACGNPECAAAGDAAPSATVVHVVAEERSLADGTPVQLDGEAPCRPALDKPLPEMTIAEAAQAFAPEPDNGPAESNPAVVIGAGIMPAPLLAAKLAASAQRSGR